MTTLEEFLSQPRDCVGCSYCCQKAPCFVARRVYGPVDTCPALKFNTEESRWYCELCTIEGSLGEGYRKELSIGAGCCSGLNSWRKDIPKPKVEIKKPKVDKQLRAFFHAVGKMGPFGMSGDLLYLTIHATARELGLGEDWVQECFRVVKEDRSKDCNQFMGKIPDKVSDKT
jgi:hypothetical protein